MATALLTTASLVMSMRVAAWAVLLPAAVTSTLATAIWRRPRPLSPASELVPPLLIAAVAVALAVGPAVARGTQGPQSLAIYDAWGYIETDAWLQHHSLQEKPPAGANRWDLDAVFGHAHVMGNQRIGVDVVNAAVSSVLGVGPDETNLPFLAAVFALLPLLIWLISRELGASLPAAAAGVLFAVSPAVLMLVFDSALGNLAGLVLSTTAVFVATSALKGGRLSAFLLTGIVFAGLVSAYPEFVAPTLIALLAGVTLAVVHERRPWAWVRRLAVMGAIVLVAAPVGVTHAAAYLTDLAHDNPLFASLPPRHLTAENGAAWAFGILQLYQLPRFDLLSTGKTTIALALPGVAALVLLAGLLQRSLRPFLLYGAPIATAIAFGLVALHRYQGGECEYCMWKSLTFMLPFLGVGFAVGLQRIAVLARGFPHRRFVVVGLAVIVCAQGAALAHADAKLAQAQYNSPAVVDGSLRWISRATHDLPPGSKIFIEAMDATAAPKWTVPASYYLTQPPGPDRISFVPAGDSAQYLGLPTLSTGTAFYSSNYRYVVTPLSAVRSDRRLLVTHPPYGLYERAPIDVALVNTGWVMDFGAKHPLAWIQRPFELWIASPRPGPASLSIRLRMSGGPSTLTFRSGKTTLNALHSADERELCVPLRLKNGLTRIAVEPTFARPPSAPVRATEEDPIPRLDHVLAVEKVAARRSPCSASFIPGEPVASYRSGWEAPEGQPGATFRWMGTTAKLVLEAPSGTYRRVRLTAEVTSLAKPRVLTIRRGREQVGRIRVPTDFKYRKLELSIPSGRRATTLTFVAAPPAQSASIVNPADKRLLAIGFANLKLTRS
jgi:hypothetical protein